MKPFLKWAGGKTQLLPEIKKRLPDKFNKYIEPFVGGGAVLFYLINDRDINEVYINDINKELINCYDCVINHTDALIMQLWALQSVYNHMEPNEQEEIYYKIRTVFNNDGDSYFLKPSLSPIITEMNVNNYKVHRAAKFIFLNKTCFNGLWRVNKNNEFNVPWNKKNKTLLYEKDNLFEISEKLKNTTLFSYDYSKLIDYVDGNTFIYLDPPYKPLNKTSSFNLYNKDNFTDDEQIRLKEFCDEVTKRGGKFMLSNSATDDNFFEELYKDYKIEYIDARRQINSKGDKRGKIKEILITNY